MRVLPLTVTLLGAVLALGCSSATAPDEVKVVGAIVGLSEGSPQIEVPAVVQRGQPFTVKVTTFGSSCTQEHDTEVEVSGGTALITPYDLENRTGPCLASLLTFEHTAAVTFDEVGGARVEIRGREVPGGPILTVTRTVIVE